MQGESITPNTNIEMGSTHSSIPSNSGIDPTNYYGGSFDYNEWVKSKIKDMETEQQFKEQKKEREIEILNEKVSALDEQKNNIDQSESRKSNLKSYNDELSKKAEIKRENYERAKLAWETGPYQERTYDQYLSEQKAMEFAGGFTSITPGVDVYNEELNSAKSEMVNAVQLINKAETGEESSKYYSKFNEAADKYQKLLKIDPLSEEGKKLYPARTNVAYNYGSKLNQQGGGAAVNAAYMAGNIAATSAQTASILGNLLNPKSTSEQKVDVAKANLDANIYGTTSKLSSIEAMYQSGKDENGNPLTEGQKNLLVNTYKDLGSKLNEYQTGSSAMQLQKLQNPYATLASDIVGSISIGKTPSLDKKSGNDIYSSKSGEVVATEDKKFTPLSTITELFQKQHGTGEYSKYADKYQNMIGTFDPNTRSNVENSKAENSMVDSIKSKNILFKLLKNPNIKDPFPTLDNTIKTKEMKDNLPIVKYDQNDYILPKSGLPILLSDYMKSSDKDKDIMSKTPAENLLGNQYNEYKDKSPAVIDIINEMPKYGGTIIKDGNFGILGQENIGKIIDSYNQTSYRDPNSIIRDMNGNIFQTSYINNEGKKIDAAIDPKDIIRDEQGNRYINRIGAGDVQETGISLKSGEILPYNKNLQDSSNMIITNPIRGYSSDITGLITPAPLSPENKNYKSIISQLGRQFATGNDQKMDLDIGSSVKLYPEDKKVLPVNDIQNYMGQRNQISKLVGASFQKQDQPGITGLKNVLTRVNMPDLNMGNLGKKNTGLVMFRKSKQSKPKIDIKKLKKSNKSNNIVGFNFDKLVSNVSIVKEKNEKEKSEKKLSGLKFNFDFKIPKIDISLKKKRVK